MATFTRREILESGADPAELVRRLRSFSKSATILDGSDVRERYGGHWVAAHQGHVVGDALSLEALLRRLDALGLPRAEVAVQFMSDDDAPLIV